MKPIRIAALVVLGYSAAIASANVTFYDMFKTGGYTQTSDAQPVNADGYFYAARIITDTPGDATSGTLTLPNNSTQTLSPVSPTVVQFASNTYATLADLDADFPTGAYGYSIDSGTLAGQTASLSEPANDFADAVPYLTNGGYSALQNVNASSSVALTWNTFGHSGNANLELVFFDVFDSTTNQFVYSNSGAEGVYTGDTISAGILTAGHTYAYDLYFSSRYEFGGQGFGGATSDNGFDLATTGTFTAVPEPASVLVLVGGLALLRRRKGKPSGME